MYTVKDHCTSIMFWIDANSLPLRLQEKMYILPPDGSHKFTGRRDKFSILNMCE